MIVVFGLLFIAICRNLPYERRLLASVTVAFVTALSYYVYYSDFYYLLEQYIGYWGYLSLAPTLSILLLYFIRGNTAFALMGLFAILNAIHLICFLFEPIGVYEYAVWGFFFVEIAILLSERVSNAVIYYCCRICDPFDVDNLFTHHLPKGHI